MDSKCIIVNLPLQFSKSFSSSYSLHSIDSQNSLNTSKPTVDKLLEVDAELATQEVELVLNFSRFRKTSQSQNRYRLVWSLQILLQHQHKHQLPSRLKLSKRGWTYCQDEATPELDQSKTDTTVDVKTPAVSRYSKRRQKNPSPSKSRIRNLCPAKKTSRN